MGSLTGVHGDSGHGKSSLFMSFVIALYRRAKGPFKARLITADNWECFEPAIDAGILEVWPVSIWNDHPFETLGNATKGLWPVDPFNPKSKLTKDGLDKIGLYMWEGGSHFSDILMHRLAEIGGEGTYVGPGTRVNTKQQQADLISFKDGEYGVGGNSMTHYNVVQKEMRANIFGSSSLPCPQLWSFHTVKAVEDGTPIFGPQLAGKAATPKVQAWFSSLLHAHRTVEKGKDVFRLYLKQHIDKDISTTIPFKAVQRIPLQLLDPKYKEMIQTEWDRIVPEYLEWTNRSDVAEEYLNVKAAMREAAAKILLSRKGV